MRLVGFDIETAGVTERAYALQPHRIASGDAWITSMVAVWDDKQVEAYQDPTLDQIEDFLQRAIDADAHIVGWNTPFDCSCLMAAGAEDLCMKAKWLDGMVLWKHRQNVPKYLSHRVKSYGLKAAVATFLPEHAGYEQDIDFQDMSPEMRAKRMIYNTKDSAFTLLLAKRFLGEMPPLQKRTALIEAKAIQQVAQAKLHGVKINRAAVEKIRLKWEQIENTTYTGVIMVDPSLDEKALGSPAKLSRLFREWGLYEKAGVRKMTPAGNDSTDKEVMAELSLFDPRAKLIFENREANYLLRKFAYGPIESIDYNGDGYTRPEPIIFGTYTGRMTYSSKQGKGKSEVPTGVAMHQWKRDPEFRDEVEAPEGHVLLECDWAGQEYRWMAVFSGDPLMLELCQPGEDAHGYMGSRIGRVDYRQLVAGVHNGEKEPKRLRQLGKVGNLSLQYRTGANRLSIVARVQHKIPMELQEAKVIHATYLSTYKRVPVYWKRQIIHARQHGYVSTIGGRTVDLQTGEHWTRDDQWGRESTAINFPIQGSGADQKYLGIACAQDVMRRYDMRFYFELHDGIYFIVPERYAERAAREMKAVLSNLPYQRAWGFNSPIQFPVDAKLGKTWGSMKEVQ